MAVILNPTEPNNAFNNIVTLGIFACLSCVIMMFKFGFKANLFASGKNQEVISEISSMPMLGAYRINREELYVKASSTQPPKTLPPSAPKLPPNFQPNIQPNFQPNPQQKPQQNPQPNPQSNPQPNQSSLRPAKSTSDLMVPKNVPPNLSQSMNNISDDPRGGTSANANRHTIVVEEGKNKVLTKDQKLLEKRRLKEQKDREKAAAKEQAKQEKLRKNREKQAAKEQAKLDKANKKKGILPRPVAAQTVNPQAANPQAVNPLAMNPLAVNPVPSYSTNTMKSSISTSSGPPPYAEEVPSNTSTGNTNPGNVSFGKPIKEETSSWDMVSQHRAQMSRPVASTKESEKPKVMDLQYKAENKSDA